MQTQTALSNEISEPVALVGIGCRFPGGVQDANGFWELLCSGDDAVVEVPAERWNIRRFHDADHAKPGKMYIQEGGFLQQRIDEFDALFFGISPREAECMDPQQRLLLETSWEALEDAGIAAESLAGSNTGVYIGAFTLDHMLTNMGRMNRDLVGPHTAIGSTMTILSNRISYTLDLRGPSVSMDTACSSSLVALHMACQAIRRGECDLALAGGVNVMSRPEYPLAMCKGGFLAPDGRSKSFDERANGYGRGEGAGVVVLKPLSAALRDGDSIYALIRGTGVNQDGRTNGITVPNPEAQAALIRAVCQQADVNPADIHYFEAHGTGTPVGDPLEARALGSVVGAHRSPDRPCLLGSAKATIGHTEAAAGVAGVIKTAMVLNRRQVPPQANLIQPNPNIPFAELGLRLPRALETLAPDAEILCAGVNSFGYGGTNAHAILQAPPAPVEAPRRAAPGQCFVVPFSARSEGALADLARAWLARFPEDDATPLADLAYSAACRRGHLPFRLAVTGDSLPAIREQLQAYAEQGTGQWFSTGKATEAALRPVFVYTGMGPQWWGMGQELYRAEPVYRAAVEECDAIFQRLSGWSILAEMLKDEANSRIGDTELAQPSNFVIQVGLTAMLRARGIEPAAIVGHSVGEVSAAYAAGVLTLEEAVKVSYHRSRIQKKAAGLGRMMAVGLGLEQCAELLELTGGAVSIAAVNSPSAVTLAGEGASLEAIAAYLTRLGTFNRFLQVEVAYHSAFMEPLKPEVRAVLADLRPRPPRVPLYSTVLGDRVEGVAYDAEYWCENIREPVYFAKAMSSLLRDGHRLFLEVGPHPVLSSSIKECCRAEEIEPLTTATLRRGRPEPRTFHLGLAALYTAGAGFDWKRFFPADARYVKLPTYPWQRERYWREAEESVADRVGAPVHPILDSRLPDPRPSWQGGVNRHFLPYLDDHRVDGLVVMAGAAYIEAALAAQREIAGEGPCALTNLRFQQAMVLEGSDAAVMQVHLNPASGEYGFFSRGRDERFNWRQHAAGSVGAAEPGAAAPLPLDEIAARCAEAFDIEALYADLSQRGLHYGPYFRTVRELKRCDGEILARVALNPDLQGEFEAYRLHPTLLDGCFQSLIAALGEGGDQFYMPVSIRRLGYHGRPGSSLWCHGRLTAKDPQGIEGDLYLYGEDGELKVAVEGLVCRALSNQHENPAEQLAKWAYGWQWQAQELTAAPRVSGTWLVFADQGGRGEALAGELEASGNNLALVVKAAEVFGGAAVAAMDEEALARVRDSLVLAKSMGCVGVAYLWGLDSQARGGDPGGIGQASAGQQVLRLLGEVFEAQMPRCYLVTAGAQWVTSYDLAHHVEQNALVGLARVAHNEYPSLRCTLVELDEQPSELQLGCLVRELLANDGEDDVAWREDARYVHRLQRLAPEALAAAPAPLRSGAEVPAFRLIREAAGQGIFQAMSRPAAEAGAVVVALDYVNLDGADGRHFAVGRIAGQPESVPVLAVTEGGIASHAVCDASRVFPVPGLAARSALAAEELAVLGTTVIPVFHALRHVARMRAGEAVLVDADAGAWSLTALELCRRLGVEAVPYSADPARLLALGSAEVLDVAAPDFAARIEGHDFRAWLRGEAAHPAVVAALDGKDPHEIALASAAPQALKDGSFSRVDGMALALRSPDLFRRRLEEVAALLAGADSPRCAVHPLAPEEFLAGTVDDAAHTGVLVLADRARVAVQPENALFDAEASYLITGGFGGFGLEAARWMARQGARNLVLVGRRGAADEAARKAVRALERSGVKVMAVAADIADGAEVQGLLDRIAAEFPVLKGVFHSAAVLDDAPIAELDPARMHKAMAAKTLGAWHLHRLTQDLPLEHFVLFSSVAALIGNARQANYVAANAYLDGLAWHRRSQGLPALSVNWGAIATGMATSSEEVRKHLEGMGIALITAEQALSAWAALAPAGLAQAGIMDVSWSRWAEFEPTGGKSPRFAGLVAADGGGAATALTGVLGEIAALAEAERGPALCGLVVEQVAKTLRLPAGKIDPQRSLTQMGLDSLLAAELQVALYQTFGVRLSTLELMRGQSLAQLAELLLDRAGLAGAAAPAVADDDGAASLVDRLSEEDVDALLKQMLAQEEK